MKKGRNSTGRIKYLRLVQRNSTGRWDNSPSKSKSLLLGKKLKSFGKKSGVIKKNTMKKLNELRESKKERKRLNNKNGKASN